MRLLADEDVRARVGPIQGPTRAPVGSKDEELSQRDAIARADLPTCRLPASGLDFSHQERLVLFLLHDPVHVLLCEKCIFPEGIPLTRAVVPIGPLSHFLGAQRLGGARTWSGAR